MALLVQRAAAAAPGFVLTRENAAPLAAICRRLDGIPLALELAAARLAVLTPHELAAGLDDAFALLTTGPRTAPARHRTLRAALDWGYELLDPQEQAVVRRLSVFHTPASFAQARDVALPGSGPAGLDVVLGLVEKSLLVRSVHDGRSRVRMHETVRQFGRQRLEETPGELSGTLAAHAGTVRDLVREQGARFHGRGEQDALAALRERHADLQAALTWAVEQDRNLALDLVPRVVVVLVPHRQGRGGTPLDRCRVPRTRCRPAHPMRPSRSPRGATSHGWATTSRPRRVGPSERSRWPTRRRRPLPSLPASSPASRGT